jgi:hypothetical protein
VSRCLRLTGIGDAGAAHIAPLTKLRTLSLFRTQLTDAGRRALQEAIPKLRFEE